MSEEQSVNQDASDPGQDTASEDPQASTPEGGVDLSDSPADETPSPDVPTDDAQGGDAGGNQDAEPSAFDLPDLQGSSDQPGASGNPLDLLADVDLNVTIELGRTRMLVEDVLKLDQGSVVELDKLAGDPVDIYVNERLVARGEVLVLNDNFCVRVHELVSSKQAEGRRKSA